MVFIEFIREHGEIINNKKGEHVFRQGEKGHALYLVRSGLLKAYYTSDKGDEAIKSFVTVNDVIGSLSALHLQQNNTFSLVCLNPSTLIKVPFKKLLAHSHTNLAFANELNELLLSLALKKERREYELLCLDAAQRVELVLTTNPELLSQVTQHDLAAYLGITPVGLSRIKKRILEANQ